jgi:6-phosphogluconolactonase (cycloisomerase 2 family)
MLGLTRGVKALAAAALVFASLAPAVASGAHSAGAATAPTFLFVNQNSNGSGGNVIQSYGVYTNGNQVSDSLISSLSTGHPGSGSSFVASPRADLSFVMSQANGHVYALNLGDSTVSVLTLNPYSGQLTYQTTTPPLGVESGSSSGVTAIAVNHAGTILYAGGAENEGSPDELLAYSLNPDGTINPTPLSSLDVAVDGLAVSPDGTEVAVAFPTAATAPAQPSAASVMVFALDPNGGFSGAAATPSQLAESCATYVKFGRSSASLFSAACFTGALTSYTVDSSAPAGTRLTQADSSAPIDSQVLAVGPDGSVYFQGSGGLQRVQVGNGGTFTRPFGPATAYPYSTITSMAVATDNSQLFVAADTSSSTNYVDDYAIGSDGALTHVLQIPLPAGIPTVVALTAQCPGVNSQCLETQNFQVTIPPGTLTISTPYTPSNPFVLPAMTLSPDGTYLQTSAAFPASANPDSQQIVINSTVAGDLGWSLSVSATDLTNGSGGVISDSGIGLTAGRLIGASCSSGPSPDYQTCSDSSTFPGSVSFVDLPAHNPSPTDTDTNTGLSSAGGNSGIYGFAMTPAGIGTAVMSGTLTLLAPTSTPAGTYTGTISLSAS